MLHVLIHYYLRMHKMHKLFLYTHCQSLGGIKKLRFMYFLAIIKVFYLL